VFEKYPFTTNLFGVIKASKKSTPGNAGAPLTKTTAYEKIDCCYIRLKINSAMNNTPSIFFSFLTVYVFFAFITCFNTMTIYVSLRLMVGRVLFTSSIKTIQNCRRLQIKTIQFYGNTGKLNHLTCFFCTFIEKKEAKRSIKKYIPML
jgi:hypothetical protein